MSAEHSVILENQTQILLEIPELKELLLSEDLSCRCLILEDFSPQWALAVQSIYKTHFQTIPLERIPLYAGSKNHLNPDYQNPAFFNFVLVDALHVHHVEVFEEQLKSLLHFYPYKKWIVFAPHFSRRFQFLNHITRVETIQFREVIQNSQNISPAIRETLYRDDSALLHHSEKIQPKYSLNDLILPSRNFKKFQEILVMAKFKSQASYTFGWREKHQRGYNVVLVFNGPSGTGKTMAAEVVAQSLGYALYRIDYSSVQSKYIGETEKSLKSIFESAKGVPGVLLFDEGDALFSKRTDGNSVQDKYANAEVNFLLQELERFEGVLIISTNLEKNLDEAFMRRFSMVLSFPHPDRETRERLWQSIAPPKMKFAGDIDFELLSFFFLSGGEIRNILVEACLIPLARGSLAVTMIDLLWSAKRSYQKRNQRFPVEILPPELADLVSPEWEDALIQAEVDPYQIEHIWNQSEKKTHPENLPLIHQIKRIRKERHLEKQSMSYVPLQSATDINN